MEVRFCIKTCTDEHTLWQKSRHTKVLYCKVRHRLVFTSSVARWAMLAIADRLQSFCKSFSRFGIDQVALTKHKL